MAVELQKTQEEMGGGEDEGGGGEAGGGGGDTGGRRTAERYALSVVAAMTAELVTFPLDLTKTRLQLQGEGGGGVLGRGMVATARGVVREEGVMALWGGVGPGLARHVVYSGVRMELYDRLRRWCGGRGEVGAGHRAALGMVAGGAAQLVASPADLVKVRLQMEGRRRLQGIRYLPSLLIQFLCTVCTASCRM